MDSNRPRHANDAECARLLSNDPFSAAQAHGVEFRGGKLPAPKDPLAAPTQPKLQMTRRGLWF